MGQSSFTFQPTVWFTRSLFMLLFAAGFPLFVQAQPDLTGSETLVNTTTNLNQKRPSVGMDSTGNFIVVWESKDEDGSDYGIFGQLYTVGGTPNGSQFQINTTTAHGQRFPDVAMSQDGQFAVTWMSDDQDGDGFGVYYRLYDNTGSALTGELRANGTTTGNQMHPKIACNAGGDFVITWTDSDLEDIYARMFDNTGAATGAEFVVNTTTAGYQGHPDVASDTTGNFVIAWQSEDQDGDQEGVYAQLYDNTGATVGSEFLVPNTTSENQEEPAVAMDAEGNFTIAWSSYAQDGDHFGVYSREYLSDGSSLANEFKVNTTTAGVQGHVHMAMTWEGSTIYAWSSFTQDGDFDGLYIQAYQPNNVTFGTESIVNDRTQDFQQFGDMALTKDSLCMAIAWQDGLRFDASTHDGSNYGVYMKTACMADTTGLLPVTLLELGAEPIDNRFIRVNWTSSLEENLGLYEVERSLDFNDIIVLGDAAPQGAGTDYDFDDHDVAPGIEYFYRIRSTDLNGAVQYSDWVSASLVPLGADFFIKLWPNPAADAQAWTEVYGEYTGPVEMRLVDMHGRVVWNGDFEKDQQSLRVVLPLEGISQGVYTLQVQSGDIFRMFRLVRAAAR